MTNSFRDIEEAECLFIIGSNTTENHPLVSRRLMRAIDRGAKVIVADPRHIQLTKFADIEMNHTPGSDVALINAMMQVIISEGLHNEEFINERTEGFEDLRMTVAEYTPESVAEITGVDPKLIREAARMYAKADPAAIVYCVGITMHTTGVDNVKSLANLAMLTGNIGRPGTGVNPLRGQNNVQGACDMGALPNVLPGYVPVVDDEKRAAVEKKWGFEIPGRLGLTGVGMVQAAGKGTLKALYVLGENAMVSDPDVTHVGKALRNLDLLIVQDIFLTETAVLADVVLPASCWAEKDGTFTNSERRAQVVRKAVDPPGEAREDWKILCEVANRLGLRGFDFTHPGEIFDEVCSVAPPYAGMSFARLGADGLQWPCPSADHPGTPILHSKAFTRGKGLFSAIRYQPAKEVPDEEYPFVLTTGRHIFHYHTGSMTRRAQTLENEAPECYVEINPADAEKYNIEPGAQVEVSSRRGKIVVKACVTERIQPGVLFLPFHYGEAAANVLTNAVFDPICSVPEYKACAAALRAL